MERFEVDAFRVFGSEWALVTAGTEGDFNTMTVSWGGLGTLWGRPAATVYVKKNRYTHGFMEKNDLFTVSFFPPEQKKALNYLGSHSGRDGDKVAVSGLTPVYLDGAVTFAEARATLVCRKMYSQDFDLAAVPAEVIADYYEDEPPHTVYIGEVVRIIQ